MRCHLATEGLGDLVIRVSKIGKSAFMTKVLFFVLQAYLSLRRNFEYYLERIAIPVRFSEFSGKEIIDLDNGERMGVLGQSDLVINPESGQIESIVLSGSSYFGFGKKKHDVVIPWHSIRKIGPDMIIVELKERGRAQYPSS